MNLLSSLVAVLLISFISSPSLFAENIPNVFVLQQPTSSVQSAAHFLDAIAQNKLLLTGIGIFVIGGSITGTFRTVWTKVSAFWDHIFGHSTTLSQVDTRLSEFIQAQQQVNLHITSLMQQQAQDFSTSINLLGQLIRAQSDRSTLFLAENAAHAHNQFLQLIHLHIQTLGRLGIPAHTVPALRITDIKELAIMKIIATPSFRGGLANPLSAQTSVFQNHIQALGSYLETGEVSQFTQILELAL